MQRLSSLLRHPQMLAAGFICIIASAILLYYVVLPATAASVNVEPPMQEETSFVEEAAAAPTPLPALAPTAAPTLIVVSITGAVRAPDAYQLPSNARIKDLVLAAGGLTENADLDRINLAEKLADAEHVHIPRQGEASTMPSSAPSGAGGVAESATHLININTASASELEALPGIGQTLAKRVVDYRTANGPFTSVEDLKHVKGISATLIGDIAPLVTLGP